MVLARGLLFMKLSRDGTAAGQSQGDGREDGRLAIDLPPRALADGFAVTLEMVLGGGDRYDARLLYDARAGTFSVAP